MENTLNINGIQYKTETFLFELEAKMSELYFAYNMDDLLSMDDEEIEENFVSNGQYTQAVRFTRDNMIQEFEDWFLYNFGYKSWDDVPYYVQNLVVFAEDEFA